MQEANWLNLFQLTNNPTTAAKSKSIVPKWALRISKEAFKEWQALQQVNIIFFDGACEVTQGAQVGGGVIIESRRTYHN
jgi:hypothetical protein